jgi:type I restriction enzyme, S subunit
MKRDYSVPASWILGNLEDVCNIQTGKKDVNEGNPEGDYTFFTCAALPTRSDSFSFEGKSILLPGNGANVGMSLYFDGKFEAYQRTYVLNNFQILSKYIFYFFQGNWHSHLHGKQYGTATNYIRLGNLTSFEIPISPLPEQKRIIAKIEELFTQLDAGVTSLKQAQARLKRYKASVLKAACEGRLVLTEAELAKKEGRDYEPAAVLLERILKDRREKWLESEIKKEEKKYWDNIEKQKSNARKKGVEIVFELKPYEPEIDKLLKKYKEPAQPEFEDLPELPEGWVWAAIGQITNNLDGKRIPVKKADRKKMKGKYPYYGASGIIDYVDDFLFDGKYLLISEDGANLLARSTPIAFQANGQFWVNNHAHVVQLFLDSPLGYIETFFNGIDLKFSITGTAQPKLTQKNLNKLLVPLPPIGEQKRIVEKVERLMSVIHAQEKLIETNLTRAERLRQSILKRAFEGKLVPQDPNDEPASVLLERIRKERE